jgi:hypothetical protein
LWRTEVNKRRGVGVAKAEGKLSSWDQFISCKSIYKERTDCLICCVGSKQERLVPGHSQNAIKWLRKPCLVDSDLKILKVVDTFLLVLQTNLVSVLRSEEGSRSVLSYWSSITNHFRLRTRCGIVGVALTVGTCFSFNDYPIRASVIDHIEPLLARSEEERTVKAKPIFRC